jgi:hypothetical protein
MMTEPEKLAWLRRHYDGDLPNIYAIAWFTPNGMGPASWLGALVPDRVIGLPWFGMVGDLHDYLYFLGGDEHDRRRADDTLRRLMRALCPPRRTCMARSRRRRMRVVSNVYWAACRAEGHWYFAYRSKP